MTSHGKGEKRKECQGSDVQDPSKRHCTRRAFDFWAFFDELKDAMEHSDFRKVDEIMARDEVDRIRANVKDLKYYAKQSAEIIKNCLEKIMNKDCIIDQIADSVDTTYLRDLNAENEELKSSTRRLQAALIDLSGYIGELETRVNEAHAEVTDAKQAHAALQLCTGKLVADKADMKTKLDKQAQDLKQGRGIVQQLESEVHWLRECDAALRQEITKRDQELKASQGFARAYQQETERLQKEFGVREQQLKADISVRQQEATLVRQDLAKESQTFKEYRAATQRIVDGQQKEIAKQVQELAAIKARWSSLTALALETHKAEMAVLEKDLKAREGDLVNTHRALCEAEKELALATTKKEEVKAPALTVWKHCKEGDWAVVCVSLDVRVQTDEIFWIAQVKEFGFKTDPETRFREELLKVIWYTWDTDAKTFKLDVPSAAPEGGVTTPIIKRDCVLFYTDKVPENSAQKLLIEQYIEEHFTSVSSRTREIPKRDGALDG